MRMCIKRYLYVYSCTVMESTEWSGEEGAGEVGASGGSLLVRAYSRQALTHFDTLWSMTFSQHDNMDYFLEQHYKVRILE